MLSSRKGSAANLSRTTASISSVITFVNRLNTSKLTNWLEWMRASLILATKWAEFLTYDYQLVGWWFPEESGTMGDMLNLGYWQWVSIEYHPYEFLEGHICVVAYWNIELAVCILFVLWDLYSYPRSVTTAFPSSWPGPCLLYNSHHCQSSPPVCWSIPPYPLPR